jgi:hypothetical protein
MKHDEASSLKSPNGCTKCRQKEVQRNLFRTFVLLTAQHFTNEKLMKGRNCKHI